MKKLGTIVLSLVVIVTAPLCFGFSVCAIRGGGDVGGSRITYALLDLVCIAIMVGAVMLIGKLNRKT
jgi:hypothetical protein